MKKLIAIILLLTLSACGGIDRSWSKMTGQPVKICVEFSPNSKLGVTYLQFTSGATVLYGLDGKPVSCEL
jgi:hypothetical protein